MFDPDEDLETDRLLRQGLHSLPVPEAAPDFDARVHAALRQPAPWHRTLWTRLRPVLSGMACSLLITLALLRCFSGALPAVPAAKQNGASLASERRQEETLTWSIEQADLSKASLRGLSSLPHALTPATILHPAYPGRHF